MKNTPLTSRHIAINAKMAPFAGYNMPISYAGINEEHHNVRNNVGVFDVSHMGEFIVRGKQALDLVQKVTSNDAARLAIGQAQYSCLTNERGGIVDDLLVYRLPEDMCAEGEQAFMLVVNASNIEKDWNWINAHNQFEARLTDISERTGLIAVQGPKAVQLLQGLTDIPLREMQYYTFAKGIVAGIPNVLVSATGYTGAGGFELYAASERTAELWDAIFEAGASFQVQPAGLGARDTLRLEMGYCLYGNDITDDTSPLEAGLGWITKLNKGHFIGCEVLVRQKSEGLKRKLVGFTLQERRVPRHDYLIEDSAGVIIGKVSSGTMSPTLGHPIGMGYVETGHAAPGTNCTILAGGKKLGAQIVKTPFLVPGK
ncbi:MAG: glycine cleavage system aminomethyltransferase GcvT [Saprospiraceae bacterium]|jgi:aminomethyltransferase